MITCTTQMALRARTCLLLVATLAILSSTEAKLGQNVVNDWVNQTQLAVAKAGIQNQLSAKFYGLVGLASYQALAAGGAPPNALAAYAGHTILANAFPWSQGGYDALIAKQLEKVSEADKKKAEGIAVPIAVALLKERVGDSSTRWAQFQFAKPGTLFAYQSVPNQKYGLYPQLAQTKPFFLTTQESEAIATNKDASKGPVFQPPKDDYQDTFRLGERNSTERKQYDTESAYFWADGSNTSAITGHWLDIAREVLPELSLEDTALFFARAGAAAYDASITGWKVKYSTLHWRPITAFRTGYPGFNAVANWTPLLNTPAHPEYPSGHQVSVGAILEVILRTIGNKDAVTFTIGSEGTPWLKRTYNTLTAAATEVGDSRLYAGVHFRSANEDGLKLGRLAASKVFDRIKPLPAKAAGAGAAGTPGSVTNEAGKKPQAATGRRLMMAGQ